MSFFVPSEQPVCVYGHMKVIPNGDCSFKKSLFDLPVIRKWLIFSQSEGTARRQWKNSKAL